MHRYSGAVFTMMPTRGSGSYSYNYYSHGQIYGDSTPGKHSDKSSSPRRKVDSSAADFHEDSQPK